MSKERLEHLRQEYGVHSLRKADMHADPLVQLQNWFQEAVDRQVPEPNTMSLATVGESGQPSIRVVLLKEVTNLGVVFFTNYQSRKGQELALHPQAGLNFFWQPLERQVRLDGLVEQISAEQSDSYFKTRPRGSQIGAWVSPQSEEIPDRDFLKQKLAEYEAKFEDQDVPRPAYWGGYILISQQIEFWQGRENRLHDRLRYQLTDNGWSLARLAP